MIPSPLARFVGLALFCAVGWVSPALAQTELFRSGSLTWNTTTPSWGAASGGPYTALWNNALEPRAVFEGTAGTATLGTGITAHSLRFDVTGWTVTGSTLTLSGTITAAGAGTVEVGGGNTATVNSVLAGSVGLTKTGAGTLALGGTNTFTGPINIAGVLSVNASAALGSTGTVALDGSTLRNTNAGVGGTFMAGSRSITVGSGGGTIDVPAAATAILVYTGGTISPTTAGTGALTKTGAGTLRLTSVPNTVPKLVVTGGIWQSNTDTGFGAVPTSFLADAITLDGGGISVNAGITLNANRGITLGAGGGTFQANSSFSGVGVISGVGGLTKTQSSTLTLSSANTYSGGTTVAAGTLLVTNTTGSGTGTGAVTVNSGGTLAGTGTISGAVTVNGGATVRGATGTGTGNLNLNGGATINGAAGTGGGVLATQLAVSGGNVTNSKLALTGTANLNLDPTAGKFRIVLLGDNALSSQSYTITLATAAGSTNFQRAGNGTTGFTTADFDVVSGSGTWASFQDVVLERANTTELRLTFTPVPEPTTVFGVAGLGLGAFRLLRRRL